MSHHNKRNPTYCFSTLYKTKKLFMDWKIFTNVSTCLKQIKAYSLPERSRFSSLMKTKNSFFRTALHHKTFRENFGKYFVTEKPTAFVQLQFDLKDSVDWEPGRCNTCMYKLLQLPDFADPTLWRLRKHLSLLFVLQFTCLKSSPTARSIQFTYCGNHPQLSNIHANSSCIMLSVWFFQFWYPSVTKSPISQVNADQWKQTL